MLRRPHIRRLGYRSSPTSHVPCLLETPGLKNQQDFEDKAGCAGEALGRSAQSCFALTKQGQGLGAFVVRPPLPQPQVLGQLCQKETGFLQGSSPNSSWFF